MCNWLFGFYRGIGDSVCALPALRAVKKSNPGVKMHILASNESAVVFRAGGISSDEIITFQRFRPKAIIETVKLWRRLRGFKFGQIFVSPHSASSRGWKVPIFSFLIRGRESRTVGSKWDKFAWLYTETVDVDLNLHILEREFDFLVKAGVLKREGLKFEFPVFDMPEENLSYALGILKGASGRLKFGIHPCAGVKCRMWSSIKFARLADRLFEEYCAFIFLFAGPRDGKIVSEILENMKHHSHIRVIRTNLSNLMALFKTLDFFIGLDSGSAHIAAAFHIPSVVLFGPQVPELCRPYSEVYEVVIKNGFLCRPCDQIRCIRRNDTCMQAISVEDVMAAINNLKM